MIHNVTQIAFSACVPAILYFPAILHLLTILHFIPILMVSSRPFALSHGPRSDCTTEILKRRLRV